MDYNTPSAILTWPLTAITQDSIAQRWGGRMVERRSASHIQTRSKYHIPTVTAVWYPEYVCSVTQRSGPGKLQVWPGPSGKRNRCTALDALVRF